MGMTAALKLRQILDNVETVLAIKLLCGGQPVDLLQPLAPGRGTKEAYATVRAAVPFMEQDRQISPDIEKARGVIRSEQFSRLVANED